MKQLMIRSAAENWTETPGHSLYNNFKSRDH